MSDPALLGGHQLAIGLVAGAVAGLLIGIIVGLALAATHALASDPWPDPADGENP